MAWSYRSFEDSFFEFLKKRESDRSIGSAERDTVEKNKPSCLRIRRRHIRSTVFAINRVPASSEQAYRGKLLRNLDVIGRQPLLVALDHRRVGALDMPRI
jgi:hypothetical protein